MEPSYWDVKGHYHEAPESTLRTVVEVLDADRHHTATRHLEPVIVGRPARRRRGTAHRRRAGARRRHRHRARTRQRCHRPAARPAVRLPRPARLGRGGRGDVDDRRRAVDDAAVGRAGRARRAVRTGLRALGTVVAVAVLRPPGGARRQAPAPRDRRRVDAAAVRRLPRRAVRRQPLRAGQPRSLERGLPRRRLRAGGSHTHGRGPHRLAGARPPAPTPAPRRGQRSRSVHPVRGRPLRRRASGRRRLRPVPCRRARARRRRPPGRAGRAQSPPRPVPRQPAAVRRRRSRPCRPGARPADRQPPGTATRHGRSEGCSPMG